MILYKCNNKDQREILPQMRQTQMIPTNLQMINNQQQAIELSQRFKDTIDPYKWQFIMDIQELANEQGIEGLASMNAIVELSQKSIKDLFLMKYELSISPLSVREFLINFKEIGSVFYLAI